MNPRNPLRAVAGGIFLIGMAIAFFVGGHLFLTIFFIALAFSSLIGSISSLHPRGIYIGLYSFTWLFGLGILFLVGFWPWILVLVGISAILGALSRSIMAGIMGLGLVGAASMMNRPQEYQPGNTPPQQ